MPRSRGSDSTAPPHQHQRASPRAPLHLRPTATTADSNSNGSAAAGGPHHNGRPIRDRSPKLEEHRRSPRSPLPELGVCTTSAQKKRATRVVDLETRLSHAQEELRKLREQLASAEAAKKDAQHELQETKKKKKKKKKGTAAPLAGEKNGELDDRAAEKEGPFTSGDDQDKEKIQDGGEEENREQQHEEGGEQLQIEAAAADDSQEREGQPVVVEAGCDDDAKEEAVKEQQGSNVEEHTNTAVPPEELHALTTTETTTTNVAAAAIPEHEQPAKPPSPAPAEEEEEEMLELETRLWKKDKDLHLLRSENTSLKSQLAESESSAATLTAKLASLESSLQDQRRAAEAKLSETEAARAALELEVRRLRVQTDQWRKAADAAAAIISGEERVLGGRKVAERCGSMDDRYIGCGATGGFDAAPLLGSPLLMEGAAEGDGAAAGKRRGIRVFGDLWKKRGHTGAAANKS